MGFTDARIDTEWGYIEWDTEEKYKNSTERMRVENERMRLENERMRLILQRLSMEQPQAIKNIGETKEVQRLVNGNIPRMLGWRK